MGKRRNRNRNRRCKGQQIWKQFRSDSISRAFHDETERQRYKEEQKAHLKNVAELKLDLLSRTVMVGSVLPLGQEKNKVALRNFMERQYGPVQKLGIDKKGGGKFPRGRVTFNYKTDAEHIFDGVSLTEARKNRLQVKIPCPSVGYKGSITVRPCPEYKGMVKEDLNTDSVVQVNTEDLILGHWFPHGADACVNLPPGLTDTIGMDQNGTFVEENTTKVNPILLIDMEKAVIELDLTRSVQRATLEIPSLEDLFEEVLGSKKRIVLSFRFKDLAHPMELCRCRTGLGIQQVISYCFCAQTPTEVVYDQYQP